MTHFLMEPAPRVRTEMSLHVLAYNLKRVMRILGIGAMFAAIRAWGARALLRARFQPIPPSVCQRGSPLTATLLQLRQRFYGIAAAAHSQRRELLRLLHGLGHELSTVVGHS